MSTKAKAPKRKNPENVFSVNTYDAQELAILKMIDTFLAENYDEIPADERKELAEATLDARGPTIMELIDALTMLTLREVDDDSESDEDDDDEDDDDEDDEDEDDEDEDDEDDDD